jgi:hypothetical protein
LQKSSHDIKRLLDFCSQIDPSFDEFTPQALRLTPYAVATRYDDAFWPDIKEVQEALDSARAIRRFVQERIT